MFIHHVWAIFFVSIPVRHIDGKGLQYGDVTTQPSPHVSGTSYLLTTVWRPHRCNSRTHACCTAGASDCQVLPVVGTAHRSLFFDRRKCDGMDSEFI